MSASTDSDQEGIFGSENLSSAYLEPVNSEDEIDYSKVYALFTFIASMEGQISVLKGEVLELIDDSNSYWWAVKCLSTSEIGYIPAENIETPHEKLARFNRSRNIGLTEVKNKDLDKIVLKPLKKAEKLKFVEYVTEIYEDGVVERDLSLSSIPIEEDTQISSAALSEDANNEKPSLAKKATFMDKLFRKATAHVSKTSSSLKNPPTKILEKEVKEKPSTSSRKDESSASDDNNISAGSPYNILRIFVGSNIKFNATFKSITFDQDTLVSDLLANAMKKFRAQQANIKDYYLAVTPLNNASSSGEKILLLNENINDVLDSYGICSFKDQYSKMVRGKVKQADGIIKITLHKKETSFYAIPIQICLDNSPTSWKEMEVAPNAMASDVINAACERYQLEPSPSFSLLNIATKRKLEANTLIKAHAQEAAAQNQLLTFKLITKPVEKTLNQSQIANLLPELPLNETLPDLVKEIQEHLSPEISSRIESLNFHPILNGVSTNQRMKPVEKIQTSRVISNSPLSQVMNFDEMISTLDETILQVNESSISPIQHHFLAMETELDNLIASMVPQTTSHFRKFRPSSYRSSVNSSVANEDVSDLAASLNDTASDLARLESKLNGMVHHVLSKNEILVM